MKSGGTSRGVGADQSADPRNYVRSACLLVGRYPHAKGPKNRREIVEKVQTLLRNHKIPSQKFFKKVVNFFRDKQK
jgi:hypothetical protein